MSRREAWAQIRAAASAAVAGWVCTDELAEIRADAWRQLSERMAAGTVTFPTHDQLRADLTAATPTPPSFVCPRCGAESFNRNDIEHRYCGRCHAFVDDPIRGSDVFDDAKANPPLFFARQRVEHDAWKREFGDLDPGEILRGFQIKSGYSEAVSMFLQLLLSHRADCGVRIARETPAGRWLALVGYHARQAILELKPPCNRKASHVAFL